MTNSLTIELYINYKQCPKFPLRFKIFRDILQKSFKFLLWYDRIGYFAPVYADKQEILPLEQNTVEIPIVKSDVPAK